MRRSVRTLVVLATGCLLLLAPAPTAVAGARTALPVVDVRAVSSAGEQSPTSEPPPASERSERSSLSEEQRYALGASGAVLILLVAVLRKVRGKRAFGVRWKKRG